MDDRRPLVSVCVPAHNHAAFVAECLDSVVGSGYTSLELIVIDDASEDSTGRVIERWIERNGAAGATYIHFPENHGVGYGLNHAIAVAHGDFLTGLAGDDRLRPGGIECRVRYLEEHPEKLGVFADARVIDERGTVLFASAIEDFYSYRGMRKRDLALDSLLPYSIVFNWAVPGPVFMCRPEAFRLVGNYDETLSAEDWDMYLRLASAGVLGFIDVCVADYRLQPHSVTHTRLGDVNADVARTAGKHAHEFRGIAGMWLAAFHAEWQARNKPGWEARYVSLPMSLARQRIARTLAPVRRRRATRAESATAT